MTVANARTLRQSQTPAERRLWTNLRDGRLSGAKFRRQHPAGRFVLDFYCPQSSLVIELDGPIHACQQDYDEARTIFLEECGICVIRFTNEEVIHDLPGVLTRIRAALEISSPPTPSPPRWRGASGDTVSEMDALSATAPLHRSGEGVGGEV